MQQKIEPRATYRLQFGPAFTFQDAEAIAGYLAALNLSHIYSSPVLQAAAGSSHGYNVADPTRADEQLGGNSAFLTLCEKMKNAGLGQLLDIVPNHMAISGRDNKWWWDVLENGPSSRYASYFDVDWDPPELNINNIVLMPILGNHYGRVLEAGELQLEHHDGSFTLHYYDNILPVSPRSLSEILGAAAQRSGSEELAFLADACGCLPPSTAADWSSINRRHRNKQVLLELLESLCEREPEISLTLDDVLNYVNTDLDALDRILSEQNYRLAYWRRSSEELGYRRFFDITRLVGLRVEDEHVFADTHQLISEWLASGAIDGLRIDHPDGLRKPLEYFQRLRARAPQAWLVAEKILEPGEELRESWPIDGTTGYDFLNKLNGLFVHPAGEAPLSKFYREFTGESTDYPSVVYDKKKQVLQDVLGGDINRVVSLLSRVCERHRRYRDYTRSQLYDALVEIVACFSVYRTYVEPGAHRVEESDARYIDEAIAAATANREDLDPHLFDFIRSLLLIEIRGEVEDAFVLRFQQLTGPAMAKGVEDTVFYTYNRLISLNEVGGDPGHFGVPLADFHRFCDGIGKRWPKTLLATATHDTKRGEDARIRINALSEIPDEWIDTVKQWTEVNSEFRRDGFPDRNTEYLLYQTIIGAWPLTEERLQQYMEKATREAKRYTSWTQQDEEYDDTLKHFVSGILKNQAFVSDVEAFTARIRRAAQVHSLSQTLIKLTAPGIPDIYQGTELWDLSLVDPDNRRPVDFELRRHLLRLLESSTAEEVLAQSENGLPKLFVIKKALGLRKEQPRLFGPAADYKPLEAEGDKAEHVVAYMRSGAVAVVAPRFLLRLEGKWGDTSVVLAEHTWKNEFTDERVPGGHIRLQQLLARFPIALLKREG